MSALDKSLPIPLYHQLRCVLQSEIENGDWQPGQQLPNETQLTERFGVSKITVRQALQELSQLGYVRREQGRGTFVAKPKLHEGPRELTSFTEEMRRHRLAPSARVLERSVAPCDAEVADALAIQPGDPVLVLRRLRLADGEPMGIQTAYLPLALVPGLDRIDLEGTSLYETLNTRFGLSAAKARETYYAELASADVARLLHIGIETPVFSARRVTSLADGRPFEFVRSVMRGDRYSIVLDLVKESEPALRRS